MSGDDDRLLALYPALAAPPAAERDEVLATEARRAYAPAGAVLFEQSAPCQGLPLVLQGAVRVACGSQSGRSLELYCMTSGEQFVVATSGLFGHHALTAHGQATRATELVLLSPAGFGRWVAHAGFRRYVFGTFADRLADLMALAEVVAFRRLATLPAMAPLRGRAQEKHMFKNNVGIDCILRVLLGVVLIGLTLAGAASAPGAGSAWCRC